MVFIYHHHCNNTTHYDLSILDGVDHNIQIYIYIHTHTHKERTHRHTKEIFELGLHTNISSTLGSIMEVMAPMPDEQEKLLVEEIKKVQV